MQEKVERRKKPLAETEGKRDNREDGWQVF